MHDRVALKRYRGVSRRADRSQLDRPGHFLRGLDRRELYFTAHTRDVAAFREAVLGAYVCSVLGRHEVDADARRTFLARLGQEYHVAIQGNIETFQLEQ